MSRLKLPAICLVLFIMSLQGVHALGIVVTSATGSGPGTFHQAVLDANTSPGSRITFAASLAGQTIVLGPALPDLTANNTSISGDIDGDGRPDIMISGREYHNSAFIIRSTGNTISGLAFRGFRGNVLWIYGAAARNNTISRCHIGVDLNGRLQALNPSSSAAMYAVRISQDACSNLIESNTISMPVARAIDVSWSAQTNIVRGNWIGTNQWGDPFSIGDVALTVSQGVDNLTLESNVVANAAGLGWFASVAPQPNPKNIVFRNNRMSSTTGGTFRCSGLFIGNEVSAANGTAVYLGSPGSSMSFRDNSVTGWISVAEGAEAPLITNNCVTSGGIYARGGAVVGEITNNRLAKSRITIADSRVQTVSDNTISGTNEYVAIGATNSTVPTISRNTIVDCPTVGGISVSSAVGPVSAVGNIVRDISYGINFTAVADGRISDNDVTSINRYYAVACVSCARPVVDGNRLGDGPWYSVEVVDAEKATITNNVISGSGDTYGHISLLRVEDFQVDGNRSTGSTNHAISVNETGKGTIRGNTIFQAHTDGICANGASIEAAIEDNTIADSETGVVAIGSACQIRGNSITNSGRYAVVCQNSKGVVADNLLDTCGLGAIYCIGAFADITGNRVQDVQGQGIILDGTNSTVSANTISNCKLKNIVACRTAKVTIERNTITGGGEVTSIGIVNGASGDVLNNSIESSQGYGIRYCTGATGRVEGNTVFGSRSAGIAVTHEGTRATISRNCLYDNGGLGIDLAGSGVTPNVPGGYGVGPNRLINYPVVTAAVPVPASRVAISGYAPAGSTVEIFGAAPDASGFGEGKAYLQSVTASAEGLFCFEVERLALPVTLTATDGEGNTSEFSACDLMPVADAGEDRVVEANSAGGANLTLDGSGSYDADGTALSYLWTWTDADGNTQQTAGVAPSIFLPLGETEVTLMVTSAARQSSPDTVKIQVCDTTPPVIAELTASPNELWPPNDKLREVTLSYTLSDAVDQQCAVSLDVTCNEASFVADDAVIVDATHLKLRAKRDGRSRDGRIYTIHLTASDAEGNSVETIVNVTVPHDQSRARATSLALGGMAATGAEGITQMVVQSTAVAEAEVRICNIAGRHVAVLPPVHLSAGLNTLFWNGRSSAGTAAPAGRYLVMVKARTDDGSTANCTIPVQR